MIYLLPVSARIRVPKGAGWYYEEAPKTKIFNIQRPFAHLSVGPAINTNSPEQSKESLNEYRKWLFKKLLTSHAVINEFNLILDILIEEGEIILQCSCIPPKPCHGTIIKNALLWAEKLGVEGWQSELKRITRK
jgi:hypothetical protein